ncbi:MAG: tetratricopeptide repeat protein [Nodosilinea sp.]
MKPIVSPATSPALGSQGGFLSSLPGSSFYRWYTEGEALANAGAYDRALRCFEEAAVVCPEEVTALVYQAVCLIHLGHPDRALALADRVLAIAPDHSQGWLFRGVALHRLERYRDAYACYARVNPS